MSRKVIVLKFNWWDYHQNVILSAKIRWNSNTKILIKKKVFHACLLLLTLGAYTDMPQEFVFFQLPEDCLIRMGQQQAL